MLRGLRDLIEHPHAWHYAVEYMNLLIGQRLRSWFATARSDRIKTVLSELAAALRPRRLASEEGDLSMLPVLAAMRGRIEQLRRRGHWCGEDPACAYHVLIASIARAIDDAVPVSDRDIAFWTGEPDAPMRYRGLQGFFVSIKRRCPQDSAAGLADALLRKSRRVPRREFIRLAARLRPAIGAHLAGAAAARWMRWRGG